MLFGQLVVKINMKNAGNVHYVREGRYTENKEMNVIMAHEASSGQLKVLIVDNFNELQYLDITKVVYVNYIPLVEPANAIDIVPVEAPKKGRSKGTEQVTLDEGIKEATGTNDTGTA